MGVTIGNELIRSICYGDLAIHRGFVGTEKVYEALPDPEFLGGGGLVGYYSVQDKRLYNLTYEGSSFIPTLKIYNFARYKAQQEDTPFVDVDASQSMAMSLEKNKKFITSGGTVADTISLFTIDENFIRFYEDYTVIIKREVLPEDEDKNVVIGLPITFFSPQTNIKKLELSVISPKGKRKNLNRLASTNNGYVKLETGYTGTRFDVITPDKRDGNTGEIARDWSQVYLTIGDVEDEPLIATCNFYALAVFDRILKEEEIEAVKERMEWL